MLNSRPLDELAARIGQAFENSPAKDIEKNIKQLLTNGLARLDVVPRAEFDVQAQVLLRTREKLDALERRLAELESRVAPAPMGGGAYMNPQGGMGGQQGFGGAAPAGGAMGGPGSMNEPPAGGPGFDPQRPPGSGG